MSMIREGSKEASRLVMLSRSPKVPRVISVIPSLEQLEKLGPLPY
jgi:hypothetical protein